MGEVIIRSERAYCVAIPQEIVPALRALQARQSPWREIVDAEDVVGLFYGLGPAYFLTFRGRFLVDGFDWDQSGVREVTDPTEAWTSLRCGARSFQCAELLRLLPPRPADAPRCSVCRGTGWIEFVDARGQPAHVICGCHGLGWRVE